MQLPRPYSLQSKFLIGLIMASVVIGGLLFAGFSYHMGQVLENEVKEKATMVLDQVDAVQSYVRDVLRPTMYERLPDTFIIEAMSSSFISRKIMGRIHEGPSTHVYRRVALGARNPEYEANNLELKLIRNFREHPDQTIWQGYEFINGMKHFVMARPVTFKRSCLRCHGDIADAPVELVAKYGDRGFGHVANTIGGLDFVGLPMTASVAHIQNTVMTYLMAFALAALLYFGATNVIFKRIVANNVKLLTASFKRNFSDEAGTALIREVEQGDEIGTMITGIERLSDYLYETRQQLQNYATNLEGMVEERTEALAAQADERQSDVELFVQLLAGASQSPSRKALWRATLPLIARRFGLTSVAYVCTFASNQHYSWPESAERPTLPDNWVALLTESRPLLDGERAFIPVESVSGNAEGLLCLFRGPGEEFEEQDGIVLMAIGRQLGIGAERIAFLDSILRHNDNLQAIFEGITEPLLLADGGGAPIVANEAARRLGMELSGGTVSDGNIIRLICGGQGGPGDCDISRSIGMDKVLSREVSLPDGRSFALSIYPVHEVGLSKTEQAVVRVNETTHQKRLLAQMSQAEKLATVGKLASGLAHEINNPLGVILCYAELLKKASPEGQAGEDIDVIIRHTRQAQNVLQNLLSFARPKVATDTAVELPAVVKSVVNVFRVHAEKQSTLVDVRVDGPVPPVKVDPQALEHIAANLLINALDAVADRPGRVWVEISAEHGEAVLRIRDNGPGIPPENLQYVFDPFFTTKDVNKGSGLGLAVVFGFMSDLGGRVEVDNGEEGGARFTLRFPAAREREVRA